MLGSCGRRHGAPDLVLTACLKDVCGSRSRQFARTMSVVVAPERDGGQMGEDGRDSRNGLEQIWMMTCLRLVCGAVLRAEV